MAQVKVLKIDFDGVSRENSTSDDITFASFSVSGGGPVLSGTGLAMANQQISSVKDVLFQAPSTGTINQTAGSLIIDNIMAKDRDNVMSVSGGGILFPVVLDNGSSLDALRMPAVSGAPTATPTNGGTGYVVWDSLNNKEWIWNGTSWADQSLVNAARTLDDSYIANNTLLVRDAVYLAAAGKVDKASASAATTAQLIGFATAGASASASVNVRYAGKLGGFTGLTPNVREYLSATAGQITETIPVGSGNTIIQAGYAVDANTLLIQIQSLGRRA